MAGRSQRGRRWMMRLRPWRRRFRSWLPPWQPPRPRSSAWRAQRFRVSPIDIAGSLSIHANISVVEPKPPDDPDSALAYSMEGNL